MELCVGPEEEQTTNTRTHAKVLSRMEPGNCKEKNEIWK